MLGEGINRRLAFVSAVILVLSIVCVSVTVGSFFALSRERRHAELAHSITQGLLEVTVLLEDSRWSPLDRVRDQWQKRLSSLRELVDEVSERPAEASIAERLQQNLAILDTGFRSLVLHLAIPPTSRVSDQWNARLEQLTSSLTFAAHEASGLAKQLDDATDLRVSALLRRTLYLVVAASLLATAIALLFIAKIRTTLRLSLSRLMDSIEMLSRGETDRFDSAPDTGDEFHIVLEKFRSMARQVSHRYRDVVAELLDAKWRAEQASQAKSDFLANISHEIRTPLSVVDGYADLLKEPGTVDKAECVAKIKWNVRYVITLINDILDLAKVESGKLRVVKESVNLGKELSFALQSLEDKANEKGIDFRVELATPIPREIWTDRTKFKQIVLNIVGNAIKFTERGSVTVSVGMRGNLLEIEVTDTGIGISEEQEHALFSKFSQADPSITRKFGGTGLGLVLSKKLAKLLGGDVVVKTSTPGIGSTFVLTLDPGKIEESNLITSLEDALSDVADGEPRSIKGALHELRLLLAEDNDDLRNLFALRLREAGAIVETARNGKEAIDHVVKTDGAYDLVLMDVQMPVVDGYSAAKAIRQEGFSLPIVACTARLMKEERERGAAAGMTAYLEKPVQMGKLLALCQELGLDSAPPTGDAAPIYSDLHDDPGLSELLARFTARIPQYREGLIKAHASDEETFRRALHDLKGVLGSYGFSDLARRCAELEQEERYPRVTGAAIEEILGGLDRIHATYQPGEAADAGRPGAIGIGEQPGPADREEREHAE